MPITASQLYNLVECPKRVELDSFGDVSQRDPENAFVKLLWERGSNYEKEVVDKLSVPFVDLSGLAPEDKKAKTLDAMKKGVGLIYGGMISADDLLGVPDLLRNEGGKYAPIDIKSGRAEEGGGEDDSDGKPKPHYAVQLGLYIDVLERLGLSAGRYGYIFDIHGTEKKYDFSIPQGVKNTDTLWDKYQRALGDARNILSKTTAPLAAYAAVQALPLAYTLRHILRPALWHARLAS